MENPTIKVFVNLYTCKVTVQIIQRFHIFQKTAKDGVKRLVLEGDEYGFSCIEVRNGSLYYVNYLYDKEKGKIPITERPLWPNEAKDLIREYYRDWAERLIHGL